MKRFLLLAAAVAATISIVLPATAGAASWRGVVISKDSARKALVTASRNGTVRTVRAQAAFKKVGLGRLVAVQAAKLPDGTFAASAVKPLGKSRRVHFRATVVVRKGARLVVSAGGSVFALLVRGKTAASTGNRGLQPGDEVDCNVVVNGGSLETDEQGLDQVGHVDQLVVEGIYLATAQDGTIELAVVHRGRVFVKVPDGLAVPAFEAGDEVALVVKVESDGTFTLIKAENENGAGENSGSGDGVDIDAPKGEFTVAGILASVSDAYVAVKVEGRSEPVRCDVPNGFDLTGFAAGQRVYMACKYQQGHVTLLALKKKDTEPSHDYFSVTGTLTTFDSSQVTVQAEGHDPVSCAVPAGWDLLGFAAGEQVLMYCWKTDHGFQLKALKSDHAMITPDGQAWFELEGTILDVNSLRVSLQVDGHPSPVTCAVLPGANLTAFHVGDHALMKCRYMDGGFKLKYLKTATAEYEY